ncbi:MULTISPECIES: nitroreductase family protein [unclassified Caulobacter]|uniref:nitroreductase family protein n=1 Tax=unclassified Caulobacter TaxID=2648921 RepID=UPI000D37313E|nr:MULTISPECIES: nitroreductase family protein [unclassified Caulobacter]PTS88537.1 nitroreductase family protein [Caulobacter sp. HMWF009]PTT09693.1 nitroreductase family protein [Caulobacter sp. HMWF025]
MSSEPSHLPLPDRWDLTDEQMLERAEAALARLRRRHTIRDFSDRPVPQAVVERCIEAAATAPSGANQQPWRFVLIGPGPLRTELRAAAEAEEREFYAGRAGEAWLDALAPLGTDADKPFLETAPWLIAIFGQRHGFDAEGDKIKHYYVPESVGIATGFLIAALNEAGLATLTHTPSPMGFLNTALGRPDHEKPYILLVVGHPAQDATVPAHAKRKLPLNEVMSLR